jgi:hypothetical protein
LHILLEQGSGLMPHAWATQCVPSSASIGIARAHEIGVQSLDQGWAAFVSLFAWM